MRNGLGEYNDRNESYYSEDYSRKDFGPYPDLSSTVGEIKAFFADDVYPSQFSKFFSNKIKFYKI
jgi:hypothetical protein